MERDCNSLKLFSPPLHQLVLNRPLVGTLAFPLPSLQLLQLPVLLPNLHDVLVEVVELVLYETVCGIHWNIRQFFPNGFHNSKVLIFFDLQQVCQANVSDDELPRGWTSFDVLLPRVWTILCRNLETLIFSLLKRLPGSPPADTSAGSTFIFEISGPRLSISSTGASGSSRLSSSKASRFHQALHLLRAFRSVRMALNLQVVIRQEVVAERPQWLAATS